MYIREGPASVTYRPVRARWRRRATGPRLLAAVAVLALTAGQVIAAPSDGGGGPLAAGEWTQSSGNLPTTGTYFGVAFGHVDGDGDLDLVASSDGNGLRVFLGNGAGGWTPVPTHPARTGGFSGIDLGDIDGDGRTDIVAGSPGVETSTPTGIRVFRGDGTGSFTDVSDSTGLPSTGSWRGIALGDVNGDGDLDIAATSGYGSSEGVHVFVGDGRGAFDDESTGLPQNQDRDSNVALADFDNDGDLDLAVGGGPGADVFLGNGGSGGSMSWTASSIGLPNTRYAGVSAADLDSDGLVDLVFTAVETGLTGGIFAFRNVRQASLWVSMSVGLPNSGDYIGNAIADFNGDGDMDIVATGGFETTFGIHVYEGNGEGTWSESSAGLPNQYYYLDVDVGDVDGEGHPDLVAAKMSGGGGLEVWMNPLGPPPGLSVQLHSPVGSASLTGGSEHAVRWSVASGAPPYTVAISYSTDGGASFPNAIAAGIVQAVAGPGSHAWTVPAFDEARVRLLVSVTDGNSITASATSLEDIEVDSTPPGVVETTPADGETGVPTTTRVVVRFDELMNRTSESAVSISGPGTPALGKASWQADRASFPTSGLEPMSMYTVTVSTAARDDSDPGNAMAAAHSFAFETGPPEDLAPPVADGGPDRSVDQHATATLDGTASTDDVGVVNWTWTFPYEGRAVALHGAVVTFTFDVAGTYVVTLTVEDGAARSASTTFEVEVVDADPPVADIAPIGELGQGDRATLDGSASTDNVAVVQWEWTIHHGGGWENLYGRAVNFTFRGSGEYRVVLEVFDAEGHSGSDELTVNVRAEEERTDVLLYVLPVAIIALMLALVYRARR